MPTPPQNPDVRAPVGDVPVGSPPPRSVTARVVAPSLAILRRNALLDEMGVRMDGPVRITIRLDGVPAAVSRRRAVLGAAAAAAYLLAGLGFLGIAAVDGRGWLFAAAVAMLIPTFAVLPLDRERQRTSARHGPDARYLSVRTRTGIRTIDLARLVRIEQRAGSWRVLDADGVSARITSYYGQNAIRSGVESWGTGHAAASAAAQRRILLDAARRLLRHPIRIIRAGKSPAWSELE